MEKQRILDCKFKALADKNRRQILLYLKSGTKSAGEIATQLPISAPSVSYHLSILEKSHLITANKSRGYIFYDIEVAELDEVILWMKNISIKE